MALGTGHWALGAWHWALGTGHWALGRLHLLERRMLAPHGAQQVERLHHREPVVVVALGHGAEEAAAVLDQLGEGGGAEVQAGRDGHHPCARILRGGRLELQQMLVEAHGKLVGVLAVDVEVAVMLDVLISRTESHRTEALRALVARERQLHRLQRRRALPGFRVGLEPREQLEVGVDVVAVPAAARRAVLQRVLGAAIGDDAALAQVPTQVGVPHFVVERRVAAVGEEHAVLIPHDLSVHRWWPHALGCGLGLGLGLGLRCIRVEQVGKLASLRPLLLLRLFRFRPRLLEPLGQQVVVDLQVPVDVEVLQVLGLQLLVALVARPIGHEHRRHVCAYQSRAPRAGPPQKRRGC